MKNTFNSHILLVSPNHLHLISHQKFLESPFAQLFAIQPMAFEPSSLATSQALIPGKAGRLPTNGMLQAAKKKVLGFLKREEAKEAKDSTSSWAGHSWGTTEGDHSGMISVFYDAG